MLKQLSLWPTQEEPSQTLEIWQTFDHKQQKKVITALAHLIGKIIYPEQAKQTREANYE